MMEINYMDTYFLKIFFFFFLQENPHFYHSPLAIVETPSHKLEEEIRKEVHLESDKILKPRNKSGWYLNNHRDQVKIFMNQMSNCLYHSMQKIC